MLLRLVGGDMLSILYAIDFEQTNQVLDVVLYCLKVTAMMLRKVVEVCTMT
jgi:hypothetical protein